MARHTLAWTALALISVAGTAHAQEPITGLTTTIDFNTYAATGLVPSPTVGQLDSDAWLVTGMSADLDPLQTYGATLNSGDFARGNSDGGVTSGGLYSFLVDTSDRAFGVQISNDDMTPGSIFLRLVNDTGAPITEMTIEYELWVRPDQDKALTVAFATSADGTTFTDHAAVLHTTPTTGVTDPPWAVNEKSVTITGLDIADGANFYLRWNTAEVAGGSGSHDEIAIDDVVIHVPGCSDGIVQATEECDDGGLGTGDGCDDACMVESGYACADEPSTCTTGCGDGTLGGQEECDDTAPAENGDGCSDICRVEPGYLCDASSPTVCAPDCGDGVMVSPETCDDGNEDANDGCSATCTLETGFICATPGMACVADCGDTLIRGAEVCDDGDELSGDGCSATCQEEAGYDCTTAEPSVCTATCGDSVIAIGAETCDDGDAIANDGCSDACAVETGWMCTTGGVACTETCADGLVVGAEACDDDNTTAGDGCGGCPGVVEHGFTCADEPSTCASDCGDSLVASNEECDDGAMTSGDGCDEACGTEAGWVCSGEPSVCVEDTLCGNGMLDGLEECDDGARDAGDGCSSGCTIEFGYVCDGEPSACAEDGDGDGVANDDDNCPTVSNPQQPDEDGDGIGDICDDDVGVPGPDGCCAVGHGTDERAGWLLLAALVMGVLHRRPRCPTRRRR